MILSLRALRARCAPCTVGRRTMSNQSRPSDPSIDLRRSTGTPRPADPPKHGIPCHDHWSPYEPEELAEDEHTRLGLSAGDAHAMLDSLDGLSERVAHEADRDAIVETVRAFAGAMRERIAKLSPQNPSSISVPTTGTRDKS